MTNRGVVYKGPGRVAVESIPDPKFETPAGRKITHGVILKVFTTNICGSEQHMVRGRTSAPAGMVLGHEITGEIIECGSDVEYLKLGDLVSVPFNVACGRCRTCREGRTDVCLNTNDKQAGGAYGYVDLGGWVGGQAEYVMVPYADFNLLRFPDKAQAKAKILDLTMLTDILPTGFHGALNAGVQAGSTVYVAGAGPVGLAAAAASRLLGAAVVLIGDFNKARLEHAKAVGFEPVDLSGDAPLAERIAQVLKVPEVDAFIDCVGFEAKVPRITVDWDTSQADDFRTRCVPWTMKQTSLAGGRATRSDRKSLAQRRSAAVAGCLDSARARRCCGSCGAKT